MTKDILKNIQAAANPERAKEILADLIRIPSYNPSGNEAQIASYVADVMEAAGCEVEVKEVVPGRPNVIARLKGEGAGKTIILNTHLDVVPAGEGWNTDPLKMEIKDGRAYGRGVMDAKGPLASMMAAMEAIALSDIKLKGDVVLAAVADEEGASLGAKELITYLSGDYAIVGESTNGNLALAHRGSLRPVLVAEGVAAHSSTPNLGINAVSLITKAIVALEEYAQTLSERKHPLTGQSTLSVTVIRGGIKESMIPDRCEAVIDRRLVPGEDEETAIREMEEVIRSVPGLEGRVRLEHFIPTSGGASEIDSAHPIVELAAEAIEHIYGKKPDYTGLTCNCDMSSFMRAGIPTAVYGPGDFSIAHTANEWVLLSELEKATMVYAGIAIKAAEELKEDIVSE